MPVSQLEPRNSTTAFCWLFVLFSFWYLKNHLYITSQELKMLLSVSIYFEAVLWLKFDVWSIKIIVTNKESKKVSWLSIALLLLVSLKFLNLENFIWESILILASLIVFVNYSDRISGQFTSPKQCDQFSSTGNCVPPSLAWSSIELSGRIKNWQIFGKLKIFYH